jgi:hypothetical protein
VSRPTRAPPRVGVLANRMAFSVHPAAHTSDYVTWRKMVARCGDPYNRRWSRYGGAGINVCERWRTFDVFRRDMGPRPNGHVLARRDRTGGYTPENCFWEPREESARRCRSTMTVTYMGETLLLAEWARRTGLRKRTIRSRILILRWSVGQALGFEPRTVSLCLSRRPNELSPTASAR